jgi:hypothetical protein
VKPEPIFVACLLGLFCLAPVALYLLWLALLARRDRPTVVSGPWDFAALVGGLAGFILLGGGVVLSLLQSGFRYWMRGNLEAFRGAWNSDKNTWIFLSAVYLLLVVGGVALALVSRRRTLVVYNVETVEFEATLAEVFEQLGRPAERKGRRWVAGVPLCELERVDGGHAATLRWLSDDRQLFQEVERVLREAVVGLAPEDNPAARWLMAVAGGAGFWAACCFGLLLVYVFSLR